MRKFVLGSSPEQVRALLPNRKIMPVSLGGVKIAVVRINDDFFAFERLCPHQKTSLEGGNINAFEEVICPLHHYRFDLHTGEVRSGDCRDLQVYEAKLGEKGLEIIF
jgi:nitrite reductase/ring-hydroxylating ferredoxin subunit